MNNYYIYIPASKRNGEAAIQREKQMKKWNRNWKLELIEKLNPEWKDLYEQIIK